MTSRAYTSAFTVPFGPIVRLPFVKFSFPSTKPSTNKSSLPVTSPLIRIPWLMQAGVRDETGSALELREVLAGAAAGAFEVTAGAAAFSVAPCGFASSFFHMKHLDIENLIFEAAYRRAGWEPRL